MAIVRTSFYNVEMLSEWAGDIVVSRNKTIEETSHALWKASEFWHELNSLFTVYASVLLYPTRNGMLVICAPSRQRADT